jgi:adenylate kinase
LKYRTILLFGAPGAGKGTQGKILGTIPHYFHCACGDVFRSMAAESAIGKVFLHYSSRGQLVPDETTITLWRHFIESSTQDGRFQPEHDTLVLDGIPRNAAQAQILEETLEVVAIFYLKCTREDDLVKRLQRRALKENRLDDANIDVIRNRQIVYEKESRPVLDFYGDSLVHQINADQTPAQVLFDILGLLVKL